MTTLAAGGLDTQDIVRVLMALAVLLGLARLLGEIARKLRQPAVLGEILAGVILGATVLGNPALLGDDGWNVRVYNWLFAQYETDASGQPVTAIEVVADGDGTAPDGAVDGGKPQKVYDEGFISTTMFLNLCAVFLLLVAGLEVDLSIVWRQGKAALLVSTTGMVIPFALGFALAYWLPRVIGYDPASDKLIPFALFVGIAMSITALPVIAKILMDINMFRSDMGMLIMSSAMVNDLLGWIGFAIVLALIGGEMAEASGIAAAGSGTGLAMTVGMTLLFVGGMLTVGRWLAHKALPLIQAHTSWPGGVLGFVLVVALACAAATEAIGIHSIFGAFIAGVAIGDSKHLRAKTRETIEQFISNIFAPIFFAGIGLRVNFVANFDLLSVVIVLAVAILGKVIGCYLGASWAGLPKRESWAVGFGMSARGAIEIILGQLALVHGLITEKLFVAIVIMAIATSLLAGPVMQIVLRRKQKRRLVDFFNDKGFAGQLRSTTRRDAIRELAAAASMASGIEPATIDEAVWQREEIVSTGLPNGVAVPHARLPGLARPIIAVGLSNAGVDFDAPDGTFAELICMLLTPEDEPEAQLEMLQAVAEAFEQEDARRLCLASANATEFRAALMTSVQPQAH